MKKLEDIKEFVDNIDSSGATLDSKQLEILELIGEKCLFIALKGWKEYYKDKNES